MVETNALKKFIGNVNLYRTIDSRPRSFLQRNVNQFLDIHQQHLELRTNNSLSSSKDMSLVDSDGWDWKYTASDMTDDLSQGRNPVLRIEPKEIRLIRPPVSNAHAATFTGLRLPCRVEVYIYDTRGERKNRITVDSQQGLLVGFPGSTACRVELPQPFIIEIEKLFVIVESGKLGGTRWKQTALAQYKMELYISCEKSDDAAELVALLEDVSPRELRHVSAKRTLLRTAWAQLPDCPPIGWLHKVQRMKEGVWTDSKYGLDMTMAWRRPPVKSMLPHYPKLKTQTQLPTPSISEDSDLAKAQQVIYVFQQDHYQRCKVLETLSCVLCRTRLPHTSFDRLYFHLLTHHEHFKFHVEDVLTADDGVTHKTIWVTLAEKPYERPINNSNDNDEYKQNWVAPLRAFDLKAYLNGDESWSTGSKLRVSAKRGRAQKGPAPPLSLQTGPKYKAPEDVKDLPPRRKKKFTVPYVEGVTFYRTVSKRRIEPGEMLSESDDEIQQPWMLQKQKRDIAEPGLLQPAVTFLQDFSEHLDREGISADTFLGDACVRFIRRHRAQLQIDGWRKAFEKKLQLFMKSGIVRQDVVDYCLKAADDTPRDEDLQDGDPMETDPQKRDLHDDGQQEEGSALDGDVIAPRRGQKYCSKTGRFVEREISSDDPQ